jgi:uncharacterized protein
MQIEEIQDSFILVKQRVRSRIWTIAHIATQLIIAIVASIIFTWLHVPVSWLLDPMLIGIIYAVTQEHSQSLPPSFAIIGQAIVALETAVRFSPETLKIATTYAFSKNNFTNISNFRCFITKNSLQFKPFICSNDLRERHQ